MGIKDKLKRTSRIFINDSYAKDDSKNVTGHETTATGAEEPEVKETKEPLETGATEQEGVIEEGNDPVAQEAVAQTDASEGQLPTQDVSAVQDTELANATEPVPATETIDQSEAVPEPAFAEAEANPEPVVTGSEVPDTNPQTEAAPQVTEPVSEDVPAVSAGEENSAAGSPLGLQEAVNDDAGISRAEGAEGAKDTAKPDLASQGETAKADVQKASKNVNSEVKKDAFFKRFLGKFKKSSAAK